MSQASFVILVCPNSNCGQKIRVPSGRGKLNVTCPKCKQSFQLTDQTPSDFLGSDVDTDALIDRLSKVNNLWMILAELSLCQQCHQKVPAGVHICPHCHARSLAMTDHALEIMNAARRLVDKSVVLSHSGDREGAKQMLNEALRFNPYNAMAYNNMGIILIQEADYEVGSEYLERALLLDPNLNSSAEYLQRATHALDEEVSWRKCYGFQAWFAFDSVSTAETAYETLPLQLRHHLQHSVWKMDRQADISQSQCRKLQPLWSKTLGEWEDKVVLEALGDPLTKAEIWYIALSIRSAGMIDSRLAFLRTTPTETKRLCTFLIKEPEDAIAKTFPTATEQQSSKPQHAGLIVIGPSAHLYRQELLKDAPDVWDLVYVAPTVKAVNGFFRRGVWRYDLLYATDMPTASIADRQAVARSIATGLESLLHGGSITGDVRFFVANDSHRISLTVHTVPIDGRQIRNIAEQIENAFLKNCT